jgi:predicted DCC family thiol-disulfide oxidoreductase YuxK
MAESFEAGPILLFDGVCNLCHAAVRFVIRRDRAEAFRFAPLDSEVGRRLTSRAFPEGNVPDSVILFEDGRAFVGSDAALRIVRHLGGPWSALAVLRLVPRSLRDRMYASVARNRYRWFGRLESCPLPEARTRDRFLA